MFDVPAVLDLVQTERITMLPGAPTIYRSILDHPGRDDYDLSTLRVAVTGAADIPVALIEQMRAELPFTSILTGYGLTEAGTVTGSRPDDDATTIATTAGRAMRELEVIIADPEGTDSAELERGTTGELLVRGYSVMQRLPRRPRRHRGGDRRATGSCTPATSPRWTSAATSGSSVG